MIVWTVLIFALVLAAIALVSGRIKHGRLTLPLVCLGAGYALHLSGPFMDQVTEARFETVAEATLSLILFGDAARLHRRDLANIGVTLRMLLFGMPFAVILGTMAFVMVWQSFGLWEAVLLAAILTPTDAALGQAIVEDDSVPEEMRHSLMAASGLNDGIALPFIIFAACAVVGFEHDLNQSSWAVFAGQQIGMGVLAGLAVGIAGGTLLRAAIAADLIANGYTGIFALLVVLIAWLLPHPFGGNVFVSVFAAGLAFGQTSRDCGRAARQFLDREGALLSMTSFLFIGTLLLPEAIDGLGWREIATVILSIFIIRPLAIWLSLLGTSIDTRSRLFLGWFGPRGLATALFAVFILSEFELIPAEPEILATASLAVLTSAVVHGISSTWGRRLCFGEAAK